jgi:hypothetical protein
MPEVSWNSYEILQTVRRIEVRKATDLQQNRI